MFYLLSNFIKKQMDSKIVGEILPRDKWLTAANIQFTVQQTQQQLQAEKERQFEEKVQYVETILGPWLYNLPGLVGDRLREKPNATSILLPMKPSTSDFVLTAAAKSSSSSSTPPVASCASKKEEEDSSDDDDDMEDDEDDDDDDENDNDDENENDTNNHNAQQHNNSVQYALERTLPYTEGAAIEKVLFKYGFTNENTLWTPVNGKVEIEIEYMPSS